jgi:hypothetical protein
MVRPRVRIERDSERHEPPQLVSLSVSDVTLVTLVAID